MGQAEHEAERHFRDRPAIDAGFPAEFHPVIGKCVLVDIVQADAEFGDDLQIRTGFQDRTVDLLQPDDGTIRVLEKIDQGLAGQTGSCVIENCFRKPGDQFGPENVILAERVRCCLDTVFSHLGSSKRPPRTAVANRASIMALSERFGESIVAGRDREEAILQPVSPCASAPPGWSRMARAS